MLDVLLGVDLDPKRGQYRVIEQPIDGVPADESDGTFRDGFAYGGGFKLNPTNIPARGFTVNAAPVARISGKTLINPGDFDLGDVDPNNRLMLHFLMNLFGAYTISTPVAGVSRWLFDRSQGTSASRYLTLDDYTGMDTPVRYHDVKAGRLQLSAGPNANLAMVVGAIAGHYSKSGMVVQAAGAGSTLPRIWKTWPGNYAPEDPNAYIWVKVLTDNADGTFNVQCGLSDSSTEPTWANTQTITLGRVAGEPLFDVDGARIGWKGEQPVLYLPVGAVSVPGTDVFRIPYKRAVWAQSLGTQRRISSVSASILADGEYLSAEGGWQLVVEFANREARPDTFGQQGGKARNTGDFSATLTVTRELLDATLQAPLQKHGSLSAVIDCETQVLIGATAYPYRFGVLLPHLTLEGEVYQRDAGSENRDEAPQLVAGVPETPFVYDLPHLPASVTTSEHVAMWFESDVTAP